MKLLDNMDLSTDFFSPACNIQEYSGFSVHGTISGANPSGTFIIQASNQEANEGTSVTRWADLPDTEITVDDIGDLLSNNGSAFYKWFRVKWTANPGSVGIMYADWNHK